MKPSYFQYIYVIRFNKSQSAMIFGFLYAKRRKNSGYVQKNDKSNKVKNAKWGNWI